MKHNINAMQKVVTLTMVNVQSLDEPSARLKDVSRTVVHFETQQMKFERKTLGHHVGQVEGVSK